MLVDDDLIQALDSKHISHAVLDVFDKEPLPRDSALWEHEKITVLPHVAAITDPNTAAKIAAKNIENYRSTGLVNNVVDLNRGY